MILSAEADFSLCRIEAVSETGLMVYFADVISEETSVLIGNCCRYIESLQFDWLIEIIPSYTSIYIEYNCLQQGFSSVSQQLWSAFEDMPAVDPLSKQQGKLIELPACYHPDVAPDLQPAAASLKLTVDQLIELHSGREYRVCAIGFAPGFAFLASVDPRIELPRQATPRKKIMAGSIGIADRQTAVYPQASPGGWQIIGNCTRPLFDPNSKPMTPFNVGDRIRFEPVSLSDYLSSGGARWNGD